MATIVLTGIPGSGKTTVLIKALEKLSGEGVEYELVTYGTVMFELARDDGLVSDRDEMRGLDEQTQREVQLEAAERIHDLGSRKNIVVDTHCLVRTPKGFLPGLPREVLLKLRPSQIILVEADPDEILARRSSDSSRSRDLESAGGLDLHQKLNRSAAAAYAVLSGAPVSVVENRQGGLDEAAEVIAGLLR